MLLTIRKNHLFVTAALFAICNASLIFVAAVASRPSAPVDAPGFIRSNLNPPGTCTVQAGETVYDIALRLGIPPLDLVIENGLTGDLPLTEGAVLSVPRFQVSDRPHPISSGFPIRIDRTQGRAPLAVKLGADIPLAATGCRYAWDLGNNRFSFQAEAEALYTRPGTFRPRLVVVDRAGRYAISAPVEVRVADVQARDEGLPYLTVDRVGDLVDVADRLRAPDGGAIDFDETGRIVQSAPLLRFLDKNRLVAAAGGFARVRLECRNAVFEFYLFVSPLPARLSVEPEFDWYKTQFQTGMYGNCGPAAVGSAIKWATGAELSVEEIRAQIGMPNSTGAVSYDHLLANLKRHSVRAALAPLKSFDDIAVVINRGGLVILSFHCGLVRTTDRDKADFFFDRYYPDATGHYLLIKGYSLDGEYLIVYDAIPGEWKKNEIRYRDGVSMIGRNRFFRVREVMAGIGKSSMIVVDRESEPSP